MKKTPIWFWVISGLGIIWNALGVGAYVMELKMSHADRLEAYGQVLADAAAAQPAFITGAYAIAVFGGLFGCLALLLRSRYAVWLLGLSLLAVIIQQAYMWFGTDIMGTLPSADKIMYISIPVIALFLLWFSRAMRGKGILR